MADAGLIGIALPEAHGGGGLGIIEAGLVCEAVGRHVAPVPAAADDARGDDRRRVRRRRRWPASCCPACATAPAFSRVATAEHLREDLARPGVTAETTGALTGTKSVVEFAAGRRTRS